MSFSSIPAGRLVPTDINVVIEIAAMSSPVKYEVDKDSGSVFVDRFMATPMHYPVNYGYIPQTLGGDGDPLDVMVVTPYPLVTGAVIRVRPIGVLLMEDDGGEDAKLLAVPVDKLTPIYKDVKAYTDLPAHIPAQIEHFFSHYKDLEKGKWVKIQGWDGVNEAHRLIMEAIDAAAAAKAAAV